MSESVPTSNASFSHRRLRADSAVSFTYFLDDGHHHEWQEDEVVVDDTYEQSTPEETAIDMSLDDNIHSGRRSFSSIQDPLLIRRESGGDTPPSYGKDGRTNQKIYIVTEDLTVVIAGFSTPFLRAMIYFIICISTLGLAYLVLRWLPHWRVAILGSPAPLRCCTWVVVEVS